MKMENVPMKNPSELKEKVETFESKREKKVIIVQTGILLNDDELTEVSGGYDLMANTADNHEITEKPIDFQKSF